MSASVPTCHSEQAEPAMKSRRSSSTCSARRAALLTTRCRPAARFSVAYSTSRHSTPYPGFLPANTSATCPALTPASSATAASSSFSTHFRSSE